MADVAPAVGEDLVTLVCANRFSKRVRHNWRAFWLWNSGTFSSPCLKCMISRN